MALQKQPIAINFANGVETKTDSKQLPIGKFLALANVVFNTDGALTKRNGFANITTLPDDQQTTLTTFNDNLLATGSNLYAFSQDTNQWLNRGLVQPVSLSTQSLVRSASAQVSPDAAVADNGLTCSVYMDGGASYYQVSDSATGQQIVSRTSLPSTAINPRAFVLGRYFIVTFMATVSAAPHLQYVAVPIANPTAPLAAADISASVSSLNAGYDAYVTNNNLYVAWGSTGATVKVTYLSSTLTVASPSSIATSASDLMSVTADTSGSTPIVWVTYWDTTSDDGYSAAFSHTLATVLAPVQIVNNIELTEITSVADAGILTVFYETDNDYSSTGAYPVSNVKTDYISRLTVTQAGVVGSPTVVLRSVGLASKAFRDTESGTAYMIVAYGEDNQPTYFLIDSTGAIYMRLAYSNGGGYAASQVLPTVSYVDGEYYLPYLIKDFLASVNKNTDLPSGTPVNGIYTQTGVNLCVFSINTSGQYSSEIASALHLTGGQLWEYDGVKPVEHSFHVWPENVAAQGAASTGDLTVQTYFYSFTYEWTDNQGNLHRSAPSIPYKYEVLAGPTNFDALRTSGSITLSSVSSFTGLQVGQHITGTGIPAGTYIAALNPGAATVTMTQPASSGAATATTVTVIPVAALSLYVPTLRLTAKVSPNPVRIVGYRWSTAQPVYYQFTSISSPTLNNPAVDYVTITDDNSDADILGQTLLYTTGGVLENIAAPAFSHTTIFKNRLFGVVAEDENLLWFSKVVVQNTPVEMSDLLTIYVSPTIGSQQSTGPVKCLAAMDDKLVIFKAEGIYYITGNGPDSTGANSDYGDPVYINSPVGCSNPNSIVLIPNGLMFQTSQGIWLLGRDLSVSYIGSPVEIYNNYRVLSAEAILNTTQVRFILENNITLMYDYYYERWGTFNNTRAISGTRYQGLHTYMNSFGQVFQESPGSYLDGSQPVLIGLRTGWINVAGIQGYERFYFMNLLGTYITPFKLNVSLSYDYNAGATQSIVITPDNYAPAYGDEAVYGSGGPYGGSEGNVLSARVFPERQKCEAFLIEIQEIYDPSYGVAAGEGLTLSNLLLTVGVKRGFRTQKASQSFG